MLFLFGLILFVLAQGYLFNIFRNNFVSLKESNKLNYLLSFLIGFTFPIPVLIYVVILKITGKKIVWDFGIFRPLIKKLT